MKTVISLGGNAFSNKGGKSNYSDLNRNLYNIISQFAFLAKNNNLVIVPGSGPQIGALLLQNEIAKKSVPPMPLDILDAQYEGLIGYLISQKLKNKFTEKKIPKEVASVITQTLVDKKDPGFKNPSKPVGRFYSKKEAILMQKHGIRMIEDSGRGFRKIVPSPLPKKIIEINVISKLIDSSFIVVVASGGGIPVVREKGLLKGVPAVIDKDLASSCLAKSIHADKLIILTGVDNAFLFFGSPKQRALFKMSVKQAQAYLNEGHFGVGSMEPKICAAIDFVKATHGVAIITSPKKLSLALKGKAGTIVSK